MQKKIIRNKIIDVKEKQNRKKNVYQEMQKLLWLSGTSHLSSISTWPSNIMTRHIAYKKKPACNAVSLSLLLFILSYKYKWIESSNEFRFLMWYWSLLIISLFFMHSWMWWIYFFLRLTSDMTAMKIYFFFFLSHDRCK